jgi:hypothetical protein
MAVMPPPPPPAPKPNGFHGAVSEFKRRLIEATLTQAGAARGADFKGESTLAASRCQRV